jgi:hypothetical protein
MSAQKPTVREFAAIVFALARARGTLATVQLGDTDPKELKDEIQRTLKGTSAATIAKALGLKESDYPWSGTSCYRDGDAPYSGWG